MKEITREERVQISKEISRQAIESEYSLRSVALYMAIDTLANQYSRSCAHYLLDNNLNIATGYALRHQYCVLVGRKMLDVHTRLCRLRTES